MSVSTPLGPDALLLQGLTVYEATSEPFEITLDLLSENQSVSPTQLIRKPVTITMTADDDGNNRYFHGIIRRFSQGGRDGLFATYRAEVVPTLWFLTLSTDCRIFQNLSVPDIIQKILKEAGLTDVKVSLTGTYDTREYCVQYRESHFAFISRLMEEEGIFYFFEHSDGKHMLVLADSTSAVKAGPTDTARVSFAQSARQAFSDVIDTFEVDTIVRSGKVTLVDYNDLTPKTQLQSESVGILSSTTASYALYDYPGKFDKKATGEHLAKVRMEAEEASAKIITCTTNSRGLVSGHKVKITDHYNADLNAEYHVVTLTTSARIENYGTTTGEDEEAFSFDARFTAMPEAVPFRPLARTPKSIVYGTQTAVVVGPSGEEIYVDKAGRVKVQFFWDRLGKKDENSSCWVRVSTAWAGKAWGAIHIPRIGQEVVVDFLEGDPDRPIITGSVYNADQTVPYALPDNGTQSGIKTRSAKGGDPATFNELRFEDKKGSEEVYLHAEKDFNIVVENNRVTTIGNDETKTVQKGNESTTIEKGKRSIKVSEGDQDTEISKGDDTFKVSLGSQTITINKDRTLTVKQGNMTTSVDMGNVENTVKMGNVTNAVKMGNVTTKLSLGKETTEAMQGIEFKVGQNSIKIDQMGVTIKGMMITIEGQIQTEIKGLMTNVKADAMLMVKGGITMIN